jgi:uncharacterized membrane protein SpoIIM required for sporulation
MIIDLEKFLAAERGSWMELELLLKKMEASPDLKLSIEQAQRFHYLYQRASAGLARLMTFAHEPAMRRYLESLVARAYGEVHEVRNKRYQGRFWYWVSRTLPQTFRRHRREFAFAVAITFAGSAFGSLTVLLDPAAKEALMPFSHLLGNPSDRVAYEERSQKEGDPLQGRKTSFSAELMTHNTKVSVLAMAFGMTWGVGTLLMLFYNGVILGVVSLDYVQAGQTQFLLGWLLPHGSVEIPAILVAGQAGFVLAGALIGWGRRTPFRARLRQIMAELVTLISGAAILLVWAGIIEAFLSQYHRPVLPYGLKIVFGLLQLMALFLFLGTAGKQTTETH